MEQRAYSGSGATTGWVSTAANVPPAPPETVTFRLGAAVVVLDECHKAVSEIEVALGIGGPTSGGSDKPGGGIHAQTLVLRGSAADLRERLNNILNSLR